MPRNRRHYRVRLEEAIVAHSFAVSQFGGLHGIRDRGAIEAAVARPYLGYYRSLAKKGAALVQSLACNHGFIDGNKRTALFMLNLLITRSGYRLHADSEGQLNTDVEQMILSLVDHTMTFDEAVAWLDERIVPIT